MKNRNFFILWTGKLVSKLGDKMYAIAMAWWILSKSGSAATMGLYLMSATLPGILLGFVVGAIIDRSNLKIIIVVADLVRGIAITALAFLYLTNMLEIWHVFTITIFISLASTFFNPSITAIIPKIVEKNELSKANSFMKMIDGIATIIGPIIGVAIVGIVGYFGAFLINGASYVLSSVFEGFIRLPKVDSDIKINISFSKAFKSNRLMQDVKDGYKYVTGHSEFLKILLFISLAHFFIGAITVMMPFMAKYISNDNMDFLGIMQMVFGSGFVIGAIILSNKKVIHTSIIRLHRSFIVIGTSVILIGIIARLSFLDFSLFLIPIFAIAYSIVNASVYWQTYIQTNIKKEMLGRVSTISSLIGDITFPIAFGLYGVLLDILDFSLLSIVSGLLLITIVFIIIVVTKRKTALKE